MHPLVLVDLVHRERLAEAMGWEIMCAGVGLCLSTPLGTFVSLTVRDVHISYIVSGSLMVAGGLLVLLTRWSHRHISDADINRIRRRLEASAT